MPEVNVTHERPPRPRSSQASPALCAEYALIMGMKKREVVDVTDAPDGSGQLVTTHDGTIVLVVNGVVVGPYRPRTAHDTADASELWTLDDLVGEADRHDPPNSADPVKWIGGDPRRAFAVWRQRAAGFHLSMSDAIVRDPVANECRRIILASRWLTDEDAARL